MGKTLSRFIIEAAIIVGTLSILIGIIIKLVHLTSLYTPHFLGLTPTDFLWFGAVCFLFSIAFTGRRILKHIELAARNDRHGINRQAAVRE